MISFLGASSSSHRRHHRQFFTQCTINTTIPSFNSIVFLVLHLNWSSSILTAFDEEFYVGVVDY